MKSQDNAEQLQKQITEIFRSSSDNHRYHSGMLRIKKLIKHKHVKPNSEALYQLGFLSDHIALNKKKITERRLYERQAFSYYRRSLAIAPTNPFSIWGIGRIWWHRGKNSKALPYALKAYKTAQRKGYDFGPFAQNVGIIFEGMRKYNLAEKWYLKALNEEKKKTVGSYANLVILYQETKNYTQARLYAKKMSNLFQKTSSQFKSSPTGKWFEKIFKTALKNKS